MSDIRQFIDRYLDRPMQWGVDDCSLILADWWVFCHGADPAAHLRGTYQTEEGKAGIVEAAGGLAALVSDVASHAGARRSAANADGDFAVLRLPDRNVVCGIRVGRFWAVRSETGIAFTSAARVIKGWSI